MAPTNTETEVLHDERLLELLRASATAEHRLAGSRSTIMQVTDSRPMGERYKYGKRVPDPRSFDQALETMKAAIEAGEGYHPVYVWPQYLESFERDLQEAQQAREALQAHEAGYTGWQRFWLVTSSTGHIHSSMHCSTCRPTTTYALVPSLSAATADAAIEMFGPAMCSVCFPDAPTGLKLSKALAESVGTQQFAKQLAKHQAKAGIA